LAWPYELLKFIHIIGAAVLFGTGSGIAFFMLMAHLSRDVAFIARTAGVVVMADMIFTASAVILQPVTGYLLLHESGIALAEPWVLAAIILFLAAGLFWLPVVWMQARMRDLALAAMEKGEALPPAYHRLFRLWFAFGFPGFGAVMLILWLMIAKPQLW